MRKRKEHMLGSRVQALKLGLRFDQVEALEGDWTKKWRQKTSTVGFRSIYKEEANLSFHIGELLEDFATSLRGSEILLPQQGGSELVFTCIVHSDFFLFQSHMPLN